MGTGRTCPGSTSFVAAPHPQRMSRGKFGLFSEQILCATVNKQSVLFSVRPIHFKLLLCSPSQPTLHLGHCNATRWLLYCSGTCWVTGVLGLVSFGILHTAQQMPPSSGLCSSVLSYKEQFPGKPSVLCPPYRGGSFHTQRGTHCDCTCKRPLITRARHFSYSAVQSRTPIH